MFGNYNRCYEDCNDRNLLQPVGSDRHWLQSDRIDLGIFDGLTNEMVPKVDMLYSCVELTVCRKITPPVVTVECFEK